ncbi:MAG: hypothetical protein ACLFWD_12760 [Anaerolineales bacterium]
MGTLWRKVRWLILTLSLMSLAGCGRLASDRSPGEVADGGVEEAQAGIILDDVHLWVVKLTIRRSYSVYCLMKYPPEGKQFSQVVLAVIPWPEGSRICA